MAESAVFRDAADADYLYLCLCQCFLKMRKYEEYVYVRVCLRPCLWVVYVLCLYAEFTSCLFFCVGFFVFCLIMCSLSFFVFVFCLIMCFFVFVWLFVLCRFCFFLFDYLFCVVFCFCFSFDYVFCCVHSRYHIYKKRPITIYCDNFKKILK